MAKLSDRIVNSPEAQALRPNENLLINGGFDIWQRGTSGFVTNEYTADRWYLVGGWGCARTVFNPSKDGLNYSSLLTCTTAGAFFLYHNKVEDLGRVCRGQTVTISLNAEYVRSSVKIDCDLLFRVRTSVDGTATVNTNLGTVALKKGNFDDNRISFTATLPDFSAEAYNANSYAAFEFVVQADAVAGGTAVGDQFKIGGVKVEEGAIATPYQSRPIGEELALCQRYYYRTQVTAANVDSFAWGFAATNTNHRCQFSYPVTMRAKPVGSFSSAGDFTVVANSAYPCTSVAFNAGIGVDEVRVDFGTASGPAFGHGVFVRAANANAWLAVDAEL